MDTDAAVVRDLLVLTVLLTLTTAQPALVAMEVRLGDYRKYHNKYRAQKMSRLVVQD